jgi:hypothetical protein
MRGLGWLALSTTLLVVHGGHALGQTPPPPPPASVAGSWTITSTGPRGDTETQLLQLTQNGAVLTGRFEGPHQSGSLDGVMDRQHIVFRTNTRWVLTFRGRVDGDRVNGQVVGKVINGTFHTRAGTGVWQATKNW